MSDAEDYSFGYITGSGAHFVSPLIEEDEEEDQWGLAHAGPSRSTIGQWLNFALPRRQRRSDFDFVPLQARHARKKAGFNSQARMYRRTLVGNGPKKFAVASILLTLSLFGVLHLLQVLVGRSHLFWDIDTTERQFLPNWGKPGHVGGGLAHYPGDASRGVLPIPCHSHNDYWRRAPFFDALHWGCISIEADVWLKDQELYVGHTARALTPERTFHTLYLDPLMELLNVMNFHGGLVRRERAVSGVFDRDPEQTLVLLVDLKTDGSTTFPLLLDQLAPLREKGYLTFWDGEKVVPGAVTVVGAGNTPFDAIEANTIYRDVFFDAPLHQLWETPREPIANADAIHQLDGKMDYGLAMALSTDDSGPASPGKSGFASDVSTKAFNTNTSYYASTSFRSAVGHVWRGHLSPRQMKILRGQIRGAKRRGLKVRYWETPSWPISLRNHVWHVLIKEGADVLTVDDLGDAARASWTMRFHRLWGDDYPEVQKHSRVYFLADSLFLVDLKNLALLKFIDMLEKLWVSEGPVECISEVYNNTSGTDDMRDAVVGIVVKHREELLRKPAYEALLSNGGDFAVDLMAALVHAYANLR